MDVSSLDDKGLKEKIAGMDEADRITLKNRTDMFKQINKTVVVSGVDSFEYFDKIKDIYADYILGDYLSPAVSRVEFVEMAKRGRI